MSIKIRAKFVEEGDFLPGLGDGYVFETPECGEGYLSYPRTSYGTPVAMPRDTIIIGFHDAEGEENYILINPEAMVTVKGDKDEDERVSVLEDDDEEDED